MNFNRDNSLFLICAVLTGTSFLCSFLHKYVYNLRKKMRYKLLGFAVVLLIATPSIAYAQQMSPIIVETGKPVPSVVRSGEPFSVNYRVKYTDYVLIIEEQMRLDSLTLVVDSEGKPQTENSVTGIIEVLDLVVGERFRYGSEEGGFVNVQDFTYTFMIVDAKKGVYKIPSFNFIWIKKSVGTTVAEAKETGELMEFPTDEIGISYVTTIVRPPTVDIRDGVKFNALKTFVNRSVMIVYLVIGLTLFSALIIVARFFRRPLLSKENEKDDKTTETDGMSYAAAPTLSRRKARKKFLRELKALENEVRSTVIDDEGAKKATSKFSYFIRSFISAELSGGPVRIFDSDTPKQTYERLKGLDAKRKKHLGCRYGAILELAKKSKYYYEDIESDNYRADFLKEIGESRSLVENIDFERTTRFLAQMLIRRVWRDFRAGLNRLYLHMRRR